jgi:hypothetical protein
MATGSSTFILHLTARDLRWIQLGRTRSGLQPVDHGRLEGTAEECLEQWAQRYAGADDAVRLYDGRARFFTFRMHMPASSGRRMAGAVALKVRQELGVEPGQVSWATRASRMGDGTGRLDVSTVVARNGDLTAIREWAERHRLGALWVGADVDAIDGLVRGGALPKPVVVLNGDPDGATLYHIDASGAIAKGRLSAGGETNGSLPASLGPNQNHGLGRARFGQNDWAWLGSVAPALEQLPERGAQREETPGGEKKRTDVSPLLIDPPEAARQDAVLLGGLHELLERHCSPMLLRVTSPGVSTAMGSLIAVDGAQGGTPEAVRRLVRRLPATRKLAMITVIAGAALVPAIGWLVAARAGARNRLAEHARELRVPTDVHRSQQAVLQTIAAERKPLLPVIEAVHRAAPSGLTIQTLAIGGDGQMQIDGKAGDPKQAESFFGSLSASPELIDVRLPVVKPGENGHEFQITARIAERQTSGRR